MEWRVRNVGSEVGIVKSVGCIVEIEWCTIKLTFAKSILDFIQEQIVSIKAPTYEQGWWRVPA